MKKDADRIGFVGLGKMGANMARHLKDEGYPVTAIYDIDPARSTALAEKLHCIPATTAAELARQSDTILTVVTDDEAMRRIFSETDPASLLSFAKDRLFINCATVSPAIHLEIEPLILKHGGEVLEACMASSIPQAREGSLYLICGGERSVFERALPLLKSLGQSIRYIGGTGEAAKVKALVNMVMNMNTVALAEGLGLGEALGIDLTLLREVFAQTGAASRVLETDGDDMQQRDHECYFSVEHAAKDSGIGLQLAQDQNLDLPLAKASYEQYRRLVEIGKGSLDKSAISELYFAGRNESEQAARR